MDNAGFEGSSECLLWEALLLLSQSDYNLPQVTPFIHLFRFALPNPTDQATLLAL
jgi:hypothetical protein